MRFRRLRLRLGSLIKAISRQHSNGTLDMRLVFTEKVCLG